MRSRVSDYRLSLRVSAEARRGLDQAVAHYGVNLTALMEAWGRLFVEGRSSVEQHVVDLARSIEQDRRTRR